MQRESPPINRHAAVELACKPQCPDVQNRDPRRGERPRYRRSERPLP